MTEYEPITVRMADGELGAYWERLADGSEIWIPNDGQTHTVPKTPDLLIAVHAGRLVEVASTDAPEPEPEAAPEPEPKPAPAPTPNQTTLPDVAPVPVPEQHVVTPLEPEPLPDLGVATPAEPEPVSEPRAARGKGRP